MVNIDTVYQRVLAFANKEQRGYITPQEFNLFANQAQQEIFEQYFYDLNQASRIPGNDTVYADIDDMLENKMQIFENTDDAAHGTSPLSYTDGITSGSKILPTYIYRVNRIEYNNVDVEIVSAADFKDAYSGGPLTKPSSNRPIANIRKNVLRCFPVITPTRIMYFKKPINVQWGYVVINEKALYDPNSQKTTDFELHPSEETELVYKILKFAGVAMQRADIMRAGQGMDMSQIQQEKQ